MTKMPLKTPFFEQHKSLNGVMVEFGGWELPVYYSTLMDEHNAVRNNVGLFDVSHMGEFSMEGPDAEALIQRIVTRDISGQKLGQMKITVMCNEQGGIIDDLTVYRLEEQKYFFVVNAGTMPKDFAWFEKQKEAMNANVKLENISMKTAKLDVQGPNANALTKKLTDIDLDAIKFYHGTEGKVAGLDSIISRSGYTGEDGFEIYFPWDKAGEMWNALWKAGEGFNLKPCGLGCRDTLRLECAFMLYGNDIDKQHSPLQNVYSKFVSFNKDFVGKEALLAQKGKGLPEVLVGFEVFGGIARHGYEVYGGNEKEKIGVVTSGTLSPTLKKNIGLAYVPPEFAEEGKEFKIKVRERFCTAKTVKIPFYKKS